MGKINHPPKKKSIKNAFILSMVLCVLCALLLAVVLSGLCQRGQSEIHKNYLSPFDRPDDGVRILFGQSGTYRNEVGISYSSHIQFTPMDQLIYNILSILSISVYPICFIISMVITSVLFYKRQLQKPLAILGSAAEQIAKKQLDFQIFYDKEDELGNLCASFEKMRLALQENSEEMWRQMEERKRLNAAFSHDLRTPLTVLKGQSELLKQYAPKMTAEKIADTSDMMCRQIARLEAYVQTMGDLQRLEDIEVHRQPIVLGELFQQLKQVGEAICCEKRFFCSVLGEEKLLLTLDSAIVLQVLENLLSNAARFAKAEIALSAKLQDGYLYLIVSDDGDGFSKKDLANATKPFYKAVSETGQEHFGMGLNICKILCEKHGGFIRLGNRSGAEITAAFRV